MSSFTAPTCQHTKTNGTKCASPALKDKQFCFFHDRCRTLEMDYGRGYSNCARRPLILPAFEDAHSIQLSLRQVTELILRHQLDLREAGLILYALQIATSNLKRLESEAPKPSEMLMEDPTDVLVDESKESIDARKKAEREVDVAECMAMLKPYPPGTDPSTMYGHDDPAALAYYKHLMKRLEAKKTPPPDSTSTNST